MGSILGVRWDTVTFFGPVSVRPDPWDRGVARRLLEPLMERLAAWPLTHAGLFTFAQSAKHVALYGKYGFYPRFLTAIMAKEGAPAPAVDWTTYSALSEAARIDYLNRCRDLTGSLYPGLDVGGEITAVVAGCIGDAVLVGAGERLRSWPSATSAPIAKRGASPAT